jgi:hypothetical protein
MHPIWAALQVREEARTVAMISGRSISATVSATSASASWCHITQAY